MKAFLLLLLLLISAPFLRAQDDDEHEGHHHENDDAEQFEQENQQEQKQRAVMAPESQEIVLAESSSECYDSIYSVINGESEQSSLSEECNKELIQGFHKTPMGQLQQKETYVVQIASLLRVSPACRLQFEAAAPKPGSEEPSGEEEVSTACQEEFQTQVKAMQNWVGSTTVSRMSAECKTEVQSGKIGRECEQEFLSVKPSVIETLETQNNQKLKEPIKKPKEPKKPSEKPKRVKPSKPWVDPQLLFLLFWSLTIGGSLIYVCFLYYKDDTYQVKIAEQEEVAEKEQNRKERRAEKKARKQSGGRN